MRILLPIAALVACSAPAHPPEAGVEVRNEAFRIDLHELDVVYHLDGSADRVEAVADLVFSMRPGQTRPLFHFEPLVGKSSVQKHLQGLQLDEVAIDPSELVEVWFDGSDQRAWEIQRDLGEGEHRLIVDFDLSKAVSGQVPGWFHTTVDDTAGEGNESMWPTINAPGELARHRIEVQVQADEPYVAVGSAPMERSVEQGLQVFHLDTVREVSSYTVMFAVVPESEVTVLRFDVDGTPVTIVSSEDAATNAEAEQITRETMGRLKQDFGDFPAPSMGILLLDWRDGMEYYGGTVTGVDSLSHEFVHMYWGTSAVNETWRDTWMDEAIAVWWDDGASPIREGFRSDIVGGRSPIELGFDLRGYKRGAQMFGFMEDELGREDLVDLLADVHERRAFDPFTTVVFVEDVVDATGDPAWEDRFAGWVFGSGCSTGGAGHNGWLATVGLLLFWRRRGMQHKSLATGL